MLTINIKKIIDKLLDKEIVALPTDTVYGFSTIVDKKAITKVLRLKKRNTNKGFIIISSKLDLLISYVDISRLTQEQITKLETPQQKATTWIVPTYKKYSWLTGGRDTVAIRVVNNDVLEQITNKINRAIISTSANISDYDAIIKPLDIEKIFKDIFVYADENTRLKKSAPSRIVDLKNDIVIRI